MLHVHRAARADLLVEALADALVEPPEDPFTPEVVAVHSRGIERWLMQGLSSRLGSSGDGDGVAANIEFPFPGSLVARVLAELDGIDPELDPWRPARLAWTVLDALDDVLDDPRCAALRRQLDGDTSRRFGIARHLADLYDRYAAHRPEMVRGWASGQHVDATGAALRDDDVWQALLWQAVRAGVGVSSTAERLARIADLADAEVAARISLPPRLAVFGVTSVPVAYLDVLGALGVHRDVGLWIVHPSRTLWRRVEGHGVRTRPSRADDPTAGVARHPLTRSWGRDVRELQVAAGVVGYDVADHDRGRRPGTVLGVLQAGIDADAALPGPPGPYGEGDARQVVDAGDRSVQIHACWGAERQVEVLRDEILHLLAADTSLEPRDIVVLCPDIERYAPLVQAVLVDVDPQTTGLADLRVRLADRSLTRVNPVLQVVMDVLDLADRRCTSEQLFALASRAVVQRRFALDADDVELLGWWIDDLGAKWGLDEGHRAQHGLPGVTARTWQKAVERLLVGVVAQDRDLRVVGDVAPYEEATADVELAGRFAELVARVEWAVSVLTTPRDVRGWRDVLLQVADVFVDPEPSRAGDRHELEQVVDRLVLDATGPAGTSPVVLGLDEIRDALGPRLAARPSRANHRTGDLTVCTLVPMRAVPHRVVCLLGMDDGAFPRHVVPDGDDLLERSPMVGDRDARTEDRQLLLDAVMSATQTLLVTYSAHDLRTGEIRQPAVPVAELLAAVADSVVAEDGSEVAVRREHPLQSHAPAVFAPEVRAPAAGQAGRTTGFDRVAFAAANAAAAPPRARPPFVTPAGESISTDWLPAELRRTLEHPIKAYVRSTLRVWLDDIDDTDTTTVPAELGGLARWGVVDGMLRQRMTGGDLQRWERHLRASDLLLPGRLGTRLLDDCAEIVEQLALVARSERWRPPTTVGVDVELGPGRIVGEVGDVAETGCLVTVTASTVDARHLLRLWIDVLAVTLADPQTPWSGVVVGTQSGWNKGIRVARCPVVASQPQQRAEVARRELSRLVEIADRALGRPLPLFTKTSHAYAKALVDRGMHRDTAIAKAEQCWQPDRGRAEQRDAYHRLVLDGDVTLVDILAGASPCPGDDFEACALQLWEPVLAHTDTSSVTAKQLQQLAGAA